MSFQHTAVADLIAAINLANTLTLTQADVTWTAPQVIQGTWRDQTTEKNTAIQIVASIGNPNYQGVRAILYDRLKLQELANIKGWAVQSPQVATTHALLPAIKIYTGMMIDANDIEDTALIDNGDGTFTAVLTAKPTSKGWIGAVNLTVSPGGIALDDAIANPALNGLNYPTAQTTDVFASIYTYGYDFTTYFDDIEGIEPGTILAADADALVVALKALDVSSGRTLWNNDGNTAPWSLWGAEVLSNGLNNSSLPTNPDYKYALGLKLREGVTTPNGVFYLHYNDPFDPNA